MDKNRLYTISQNIGAFMWGIALLSGLIGVKWGKTILMHISAYTLILIGLYGIGFYLYFKRAPVLVGVSPKSMVAIVGNFIISALLFYAAYYILIHFG